MKSPIISEQVFLPPRQRPQHVGARLAPTVFSSSKTEDEGDYVEQHFFRSLVVGVARRVSGQVSAKIANGGKK